MTRTRLLAIPTSVPSFRKARPRYVVARHDGPAVNVDHPDCYLPLGYCIEVERGDFVNLRLER